MRLSCEHFPKVRQSCAAQKSVIPTLPANAEATILKKRLEILRLAGRSQGSGK